MFDYIQSKGHKNKLSASLRAHLFLGPGGWGGGGGWIKEAKSEMKGRSGAGEGGKNIVQLLREKRPKKLFIWGTSFIF